MKEYYYKFMDPKMGLQCQKNDSSFTKQKESKSKAPCTKMLAKS